MELFLAFAVGVLVGWIACRRHIVGALRKAWLRNKLLGGFLWGHPLWAAKWWLEHLTPVMAENQKEHP